MLSIRRLYLCLLATGLSLVHTGSGVATQRKTTQGAARRRKRMTCSPCGAG